MNNKYLKILFIILVFLSSNAKSQSLIINGSFEEYFKVYVPPPCFIVTCDYLQPTNWIYTNSHIWWPDNPSHMHYFNRDMNQFVDSAYPIHWQGVPYHTWVNAHLTPNGYYYQESKHGNAYTTVLTYNHKYYGVWLDARQHPSSKLTDSLKIGHKYCLSFWLSVPDSWYFMSSNSVGAYFSTEPPVHNDRKFLDVQPQVENMRTDFPDTSNTWYLVAGSFIADSNYKYITIGNFLPDSLTSIINEYVSPVPGGPNSPTTIDFGFYIDMVALYDCTNHNYKAKAGSNRVICYGDKTTLGSDIHNKRQYFWSPSYGLSDSSAARPIASPSETTTYYLYVIDEFVQESRDTVIVEVVHCKINVPNIFTPNNDGFNDMLKPEAQDLEYLHFVVFNRWGQTIFESKDINSAWDGTYKGQAAAEGVYFYTLEAKFIGGTSTKLQGSITLKR